MAFTLGLSASTNGTIVESGAGNPAVSASVTHATVTSISVVPRLSAFGSAMNCSALVISRKVFDIVSRASGPSVGPP